jgi:Domain of unknown function (DUF4232)
MPIRGMGALAVVAACAVVLVASCGVRSATVGASGSLPAGPDTVAAEAASTPTASAPVPWTDQEAPADTSLNETVPPPAAEFAPCAAAQLAGSYGKPVLTATLFTWYLVLTDTGTAPCTLNGGPNGVAGVRSDGSQRTLAAGMTTTGAGWFGDLVGPPANLTPGHSAQFAVWTPRPCPAGHADEYSAITIGIGETGPVRIPLPSGLPFVTCQWLGVSGFGVPQPPEEAPPPSPLDVLTATQTMPAAAAPGSTVDYTVTLANPTGRAVALSPCPSYEEFIGLPGAQVSASASYYYLNCQAAPVIPAGGSVTFAMRIQVPDGTGLAKFLWQLQATTVARGGVVRLTAARPSSGDS